MPVHISTLLQAHPTVALDVDSAGRVLAGNNQTGSMQLYEITPDGEWTQLTFLDEPCVGRYLPGERTIVVQHDSGGNERGQLSLLHLDGDRQLVPFVHDEAYVHSITDVLPGRVVYTTNRRNKIDFDVIVRDVVSGDERVLYDGGGWVMTVAVAPDEKHVVLGRPGGVAGSHQLLLVETATGTVQELFGYDEQIHSAAPYWEPDSSGFIFRTNADRDFAGIARYDVAQSRWEYVKTGSADITGYPSPDGSALLACYREDGADRLVVRDSTLDIPADSVANFMVAPVWSPGGERLALSVTTPTEPGDIYVWDGSSTQRLTDSSATLDKSELLAPESHRIPTPDGEQIPCFLYRPTNCAGSTVLVIHGGPESQSTRMWNPVIQALAAAGHAVAVPNVRGSTGYGKRWAAMDDVRLRLDSVTDLAAIHAWLPTVGLDSNRAALYGGSYGGYMVLAGLTMQPELWAAGVDIVGISSLVTFLENTSKYRRAAREREYGSLENDREFLVQASPLTHIQNVRAPLLIIHGANDPRVPLSEAEQVAAAVRAAGAECEMQVYSDEGHGLAKLRNRLDAYPRIIEFLNKHLGRVS